MKQFQQPPADEQNHRRGIKVLTIQAETSTLVDDINLNDNMVTLTGQQQIALEPETQRKLSDSYARLKESDERLVKRKDEFFNTLLHQPSDDHLKIVNYNTSGSFDQRNLGMQ